MTTTSTPPRIDISQFSGKEPLLGLLRKEYGDTFDMLVSASDDDWHKDTPCERWQVRDLTGHLLDAASSYLGYFKISEKDWPVAEPLGMTDYAPALAESALVFRDCGRWELLGRLDATVETLFSFFDRLSESEWAGRLIPHKWVGPVPAFMMATFQLMDYSVHNWDLRVALGGEAAVRDDSADVLVPYMFGLMGICFDPKRAEGVDLTVGIQILPGEGDQWTVRVKDGQLQSSPGAPAQPDATFRFLAREFCLDVYQRVQCGVTEGNPQAIETFRSLFFTI